MERHKPSSKVDEKNSGLGPKPSPSKTSLNPEEALKNSKFYHDLKTKVEKDSWTRKRANAVATAAHEAGDDMDVPINGGEAPRRSGRLAEEDVMSTLTPEEQLKMHLCLGEINARWIRTSWKPD